MEELDINALLEYFRSQSFERGEKLILGYFGTVQSYLSLIMDTPVRVQLVSQDNSEGVIVRRVKLMAGDTVAGYATSHIPMAHNREDVIDDLVAGTLGLGQIVVKHEIPHRRSLVSVGRDRSGFWRNYVIAGPQLYIAIYEHFPRKPLEDVGWLKGTEVQHG